MINSFKLEALVNWLVAGAPPAADFTATVAELAQRMVGSGLAVDTLTLHIKTINPMVLGSLLSWTPRRGVKVARLSHELMATDVWIGSVPHHVIESGRAIRHRLGTGGPLDAHPSTQLMLGRGYVEYLVCPLFGRYVATGAIGVATKQAGGYSEEDVTAFRRLQAPLARLAETEILHENTVILLSTYVGRNAGGKVMDGSILRGYSETITAVILFADLNNFTALSNALPPRQTIAILNTFFEALDSAIRANGGETLKFIGDGLLAIFPTYDEVTAQSAAAMGAISALDDARANLVLSGDTGLEIRFRAALHLGDVQYGNIGSATRLDFTAVGPAVNLTARLLQAAAELAAPTVCSDAFAPLTPSRSAPVRRFAFKGFSDETMVHTVS